MSKVGGSELKNTLYCSFCGKSQHEVALIGRKELVCRLRLIALHRRYLSVRSE